VKNELKQILLMYLRNPIFRILFGFKIISAIIMRLFLTVGVKFLPAWLFYSIGDDLVTMIMLISLWVPFVIGVILKRQFASPRASLIPGFRQLHLIVAFLVYSLFLLIGYFASAGFHPYMSCPADILWGIYLGFWFLTALIIALAYLSIQAILFFSYIVTLLILSNSSSEIMQWMGNSMVNGVFFFGGAIILGLLTFRLLHVKDECFEYPYLISWPQKDLIENQLRARQVPTSVLSWLKRSLGVKEPDRKVVPYYGRRGILHRAYHWDFYEVLELKNIGLFLLLIVPLYVIYLQAHVGEINYFSRATSNFLLLSIAPVLVAISTNYNKVPYWGYDLLKPVSRTDFVKEHGLILLCNLFIYWVILCLFFAVLPKTVHAPEHLLIPRFWAYLLVTGSYSFLVMAWMALMSRIQKPFLIVLHGIFLCSITSLQYMSSPFVTTAWEWLFTGFIYSVIALILLRAAYRRWCETEF